MQNRRIGPYEIGPLIGEGGMGQVYRARDSRLGRDVAIKILPDTFVSDPARVARFQREAQFLASLSHPNIGAIFGFEEADGVGALVLEIVDGPTLAERIEGLRAQGSGLPLLGGRSFAIADDPDGVDAGRPDATLLPVLQRPGRCAEWHRFDRPSISATLPVWPPTSTPFPCLASSASAT